MKGSMTMTRWRSRWISRLRWHHIFDQGSQRSSLVLYTPVAWRPLKILKGCPLSTNVDVIGLELWATETLQEMTEKSDLETNPLPQIIINHSISQLSKILHGTLDSLDPPYVLGVDPSRASSPATPQVSTTLLHVAPPIPSTCHSPCKDPKALVEWSQ